MEHHSFLNPLEKALRFYAGFYLAVIAFQLVGLMMYVVNVWPRVRSTIAPTVTTVLCLALALGFLRAFVWIRIYWGGAKALSLLRTQGASPRLAPSLGPVLAMLTRLLVISCVLDFLFLPAFFFSDTFLPFSVSGWRLGAVELARLVFPQAFGFAALILAFLTHQFRLLLQERSHLMEEVELTV
jgi:hypothetical protein